MDDALTHAARNRSNSAAIDAAAHTTLAVTDEDRVRVAWVDSEALRAASGQGDLNRPRLAGLVESGEAVAGCGIEARHDLR